MLDYLKSLLVDDWREGLNWATTWVGLFFQAWAALTAIMPEAEIVAALSQWLPQGKAASLVGFVVLAGRFWSQRVRPMPVERGV